MNRILLFCLLLLAPGLTYGQKQQTKPSNSTKPFVLGTIETLSSKILGEDRLLNIYLPEGYDPKGATQYPVIYLLDGSADEDFIHIAGLVQYNSFEWINRMPHSIVVGIANIDRRRDFTFPTHVPEDLKLYPTTGHSEPFITFLTQELQPYIEAKYKTSKSKTLIGQSLGGLLATEILMKQPQAFDQYIIISPSLWWDEGSLLLQKPVPMPQGESSLRIYIGVGKEGLTPGKQASSTMEVDALLLADILKGAHPGAHIEADYLQDEDHATVMHQAVSNAFKWLGTQKP